MFETHNAMRDPIILSFCSAVLRSSHPKMFAVVHLCFESRERVVSLSPLNRKLKALSEFPGKCLLMFHWLGKMNI